MCTCPNCSTQDEEKKADLQSFQILYPNTDKLVPGRPTKEDPEGPEYEVLQEGEIRLLTLHSPSDFTLEKVSLTDDLQYVAVSYCWGEVGNVYPVSIDGHDVLLRGNVSEMLSQLCITHYVTRVWLDMICINQSDLSERSKQVPLMGKIYSKAAKVYAWLEAPDHKTNAVFNVLHKFHARKNEAPCPDDVDADYRWPYYRELFWNAWEEEVGHIPEKSELEDDQLHEELNWLRPLYNRPYWRRVWPIQELVLAEQILVCCGSMSIQFDDIYGLGPECGPYEQIFKFASHRSLKCESRGWFSMQTISDHRRRRTPRHHTSTYIVDLLPGMESKLMLDEVVEVYAQHHHCGCMKDKVYGFLELVPQWKERVTVDYKQSDRAVFLDVAKLGLLETTEGGGWNVAYMLWSAMRLGAYEVFSHFIHENVVTSTTAESIFDRTSTKVQTISCIPE